MRRNTLRRNTLRRNTICCLPAVLLILLASLIFPARAAELPVPSLSYEEYPKVDGSLACVPLLESLAVKVTGCSQADAEATLNHFLNTNPSYLALAEGERDLLLAYEPSEETKEALKAYEPLDMVPVGKDALVFLVNKDNPAESLTREQAAGIFTGEITNWKQVGGADEEIKVFVRPENSGSQTLLRLLLIGDADMIEARTELVGTMEGIISRLAEYDNSNSALGYSVYYYASNMYAMPNLKFLKIDGVEPTNETIGSGEYPLVHDFYCVTAGHSGPAALAVRDWLVSAEGQAFVEECGYVSAGTEQTAEME